MKIFRHELVDIPVITLDESTHSHIYITPSGKKLRSVTTMLSKTKPQYDKGNLKNWRDKVGASVADYIMNTSAVIGTEAHKLNENYIQSVKSQKSNLLLADAHHRNFRPLLDKVRTVLGIESKLFSESMSLAGTADLIAEYDGKLSVIDYKTKRSKQSKDWMRDYFIQTTAYARMWYELTGMRVEQIVILVSSEQNTIQEFIDNPENYENMLNSRLVQFGN